MHLPVAGVQRYEDDGEAMTVMATWSDRPHPFQTGTRWPYHVSGLAGRVRQTGRAGRVEDYSRRRGVFAARAREVGLHSAAAAAITVDGAVWGLVTTASIDGPRPDHAEESSAAASHPDDAPAWSRCDDRQRSLKRSKVASRQNILTCGRRRRPAGPGPV